MAGVMRKWGVYLGLVEDDDERAHAEHGRYDEYPYEDSYEEPARLRRYTPDTAETADTRTRVQPTTRGSLAMESRPVPFIREDTLTDEPAYRITTLHPRTYNEARQIGEHFREGVPVIMNLTEMDDVDAKRLVDFAAGLIFGLRGSLEKVTNKVFLLSPQNVDVTAEDKAKIAEGGFFNQS